MHWTDAVRIGVGLAGLLGLLGSIGYIVARSTTRGGRWLRAARAAGLVGVERSGKDLVGRAGHLQVRFSPLSGAATQVTVSGPGTAAGLNLQWENPADPQGAREDRVGDEAFDTVVAVEGPTALAQALLDDPARRALLWLHGALPHPTDSPAPGRWAVKDGVLYLDVPDVHAEHLGDMVGEAVRLMGRLAEPADLARRIADNLRGEPVARVRQRSLDLLASWYAGDPATRDALVAARDDPDAEVRLRCGLALGPEGRDVVRAVAADEEAADDTARRAFVALEPELTLDEAISLLRHALRTRRVRTAEACVASLGRRGGPEAIALLARVLAVETGELASAAAQALAATGDPAAEPPLLRALAEGPPELQAAAATGLGRVGTVASVGPLREAEAGDREVRRAARQAIAEIQSRLVGAEAGQLTLTGGESGQLSLAAGEEGALTLAEGERGSPAVADEAEAPQPRPPRPAEKARS